MRTLNLNLVSVYLKSSSCSSSTSIGRLISSSMNKKRTMSTVGVIVFFIMLSSMFCLLAVAHGSDDQFMSYHFYEKSCPKVESIVRSSLRPIFLSDPTLAAGLLRLMFHDCQVKGCDGSILLDSVNSEMRSGRNFAIAKRNVIGIIKAIVDEECPGQVSCSDILMLAARDAVYMSQGPFIRIPLGRRDSNTASYIHADTSLPPADTRADGMLRIFSEKGMTIDESVAILGAHTLGVSHCGNVLVRNRPGSLPFLMLSCPLGSLTSNTTFIRNDLTAFTFDNQYFRDAMNGRGVLTIDSDMSMDPRTAPIMKCFAADQESFFRAFASAFRKLSLTNVLTGNQGVIRRKCNAVV